MAVWTEKFIQPNKYSRPQNKLTAVRKIVMHYTANNGASANGHYNYFNNLKGTYASAHLFVDRLEKLLIIPLNEIAYHANDRTYRGVKELLPNANFLSIGIEMCLEKDGSIHPQTIENAEDVAVELCKRFDLNPITDIVRHFDVTGKNCPAPWVSNGALFTKFKNDVKVKLNPVKVASETPKPSVIVKPSVELGTVVIKADTLNIRTTPDFVGSPVGVALINTKFSVYEVKGDFLRIGDNKWISNTDGKYATYTPKVVSVTDVIKTGLKEGEDGIMKLELNQTEFDMLAKVFKDAKANGVLDDDKWEKLALKGELTISDAIFLALVLDHRRFRDYVNVKK